MKKLLTIATLSILATSAFASNVNGTQAANLRTALIKAGAEVKVMTDASFVSVKNVNCNQEGGFVLLPLKCSFVDTSSGRLEEVTGSKANDLLAALKEAGVKVSVLRQAERTSLKATVKSVSCSTMAIHSMIGCELQK